MIIVIYQNFYIDKRKKIIYGKFIVFKINHEKYSKRKTKFSIIYNF